VSARALLVALFLTSLALRPQLVGIGPLVPSIQDALGTPHAVTGLLGTIPVLCMGLFAPPAAHLARRFGSRSALALALLAIGGFGLVRLALPAAAWLIALTLPVGIGMAIGNALLPVRVKERFPHRPALATGVYVSGINLGAALATLTAVPLLHAGNSWRAPLAVFSVGTLALCAGWLALTRPEGGHDHAAAARPLRLPWRSGIGWHLVAAFVVNSAIYYGLNTWLPDIYVERGWSESRAGALLAVLNLTQLPAGLAVAWGADRWASRRVWLGACAALEVVGMLGVALVPGGGFAWAVLLGSTTGPLFALTMALPVDVGEGTREVAAFTGLMLGAGYTLAALAPFLLGTIRDASSGFGAVVWVLVGLSVALLAIDSALTPRRLASARRPS
jgi:MFS transporter, CP family, cyanate transporter